MTLTEALGEGLAVTAVGLAIVFSVLIILMLVLMLMKTIFYKEPNKAAQAVKTDAAEKPKLIPVEEDEQSEEIDDGELVAVLTAAIAASLNTSTYNLRIKSYKRASSSAPAWNKAGLNDVINSRDINSYY